MQVPPPDKKQRKETLLSAELGKYVDKKVRVKFQGGREGKVYRVMYIIAVENMNIVYTLDRKWVVWYPDLVKFEPENSQYRSW